MIRKVYEVARAFMSMFLRDKLNLFFSFFFNAFIMVMLGLFVKDRISDTSEIGIYDDLRSKFSIEYVDHLNKQPDLNLKFYDDSLQIKEGIKQGDIVSGIVIKKSFENLKSNNDSVLSPTKSHIQIYGNSGKEAWMKIMEPGLKIGVLAVNKFSKNLVDNITIEKTYVQSRDMDYFKFIFPGVLVFSIMGLALTGALTLLRFRKTDVLKRLKITPIKKHEFLLGYTASYLVLVLMQVVLYIIIGKVFFDYMFISNLFQITLLIILSGILFIFFGLCLANFAPSIDTGNNIVRFINFPASFLCGIFIPIEALPKAIQPIAYIHPLTYLADAIRAAANFNATFSENAFNYIAIIIVLILSSIISVVTFKWEEQTA